MFQQTLLQDPPRTKVIYFDWNHLEEPRLPSSIPFQIVVKDFDKKIHHTIVDEGTFVSILSSTAWKDLGSLGLVPPTNH